MLIFWQMKAVKRFKKIIAHERPAGIDSILGKDVRIVQPPLSIARPDKPRSHHKSRSVDTHDRKPLEKALVAEGVHRVIDLDNDDKALPDREDTAIAYSPKTPSKRPSERDNDCSPSSDTSLKRMLNAQPQEHRSNYAATAPSPTAHGGKGQAHDPLSDHLYFGLGPGGSSRSPSPPTVSESPPAAETNIYEMAYDMEIKRLQAEQGKAATLFLTRRVDGKEEYRKDERLIRGDPGEPSKPQSGFAKILEQARMKAAKGDKPEDKSTSDVDHREMNEDT